MLKRNGFSLLIAVLFLGGGLMLFTSQTSGPSGDATVEASQQSPATIPARTANKGHHHCHSSSHDEWP